MADRRRPDDADAGGGVDRPGGGVDGGDVDGRLRAGLRATAASHDRAAPAVDAAEAMARVGVGVGAGTGRRWSGRGPGPTTAVLADRRPLLALTAAFVAVVGVVAWLLVERPGDDDGAVVSPGPAQTTTSTSTLPSTRSWFEPPIDYLDLPDAGFAIEPATGEITLFGFDGRAITTRRPVAETINGPAFEMTTEPDVDQHVSDPSEVPDGCVSAAAGGAVRVALCGFGDGGVPHRVDVVGYDGTATPLTDPPPDPGAPRIGGHWRWALVSPDGRWVLVQWSGDCEVPHGFALPTDGTGELRAVTGETGDGWLAAPMSRALGWAPDGRAVVQIQNSGCSSPTDAPGTYLLDPATGDLELLRAATTDRERAYAWTKVGGTTNGPERLLARARAAAGLEPGGTSEPSHGSPYVISGVTYEGHEIEVTGGPTGNELLVPAAEGQRLPLLSGEALVAPATPGGRPTLFFTCGPNTWHFAWLGDGAPEVDSMLLAAEALVPYLACTLREPPAPAGGG